MYIQGYLLAVPTKNKETYAKMAKEASDMFKNYGATEMVEAWEVDVKDGKHTDFRMATKAEKDESIVFSWIIWPDKETCDAAEKKMEEEYDPEKFGEMPFDGKRMMWGGFSPVFTFGRDD
ncbi:MAG: RNA signal recognition particle [Alphaproteobacteria bacterium]|nr:RNA signal recognition particle [Alphaproteobacteria bacterium]